MNIAFTTSKRPNEHQKLLRGYEDLLTTSCDPQNGVLERQRPQRPLPRNKPHTAVGSKGAIGGCPKYGAQSATGTGGSFETMEPVYDGAP